MLSFSASFPSQDLAGNFLSECQLVVLDTIVFYLTFINQHKFLQLPSVSSNKLVTIIKHIMG